MRRIEVGGGTASVHVEEPVSSTRADVILVHGAGFDHTVWRYQTRFLAGRGYRVFAPDLPGHGASDGPSLESIPAMSEWLVSFIAAVESTRPVVIGHSMGSYITLGCATSSPQSVLALVLLGTTDRMRVHPELLTAANDGDHHAIDLMVGWMHTGSHRYGGHRGAGSWTAGMSRRILEQNLSVLGGDLAACDEFDPAAVAGACDRPTLVVSGTSDRMTPSAAAERLVGLIPHSRHTTIEGAGHLALFEQSREVNAAIMGFLATQEVGAA